jgi:hypothetical protein
MKDSLADAESLKPGKTGHIKRIAMPKALHLPCWPAIPLVSKVLISSAISGSLQIVMHSGNARDLCPHPSFLSLMHTALPLHLFPLSRPVGLNFIASR